MNEQRNEQTGQYNHKLDRVCQCGRRKGAHDAHAPYAFGDDDGGPDCEGFKARKKK